MDPSFLRWFCHKFGQYTLLTRGIAIVLLFEVLRHGSCLRGERGRMDGYFCVAPSHKILVAKNGAKTLHVATGGRRRHQARCY
jgi:hypothetical protein